jgi:hypothetical protein
MKTRSAVAVGVVGVSILLAGFLGCNRPQAPGPGPTRELATAPSSGPTPVPITISSSVPSELNPPGGAPAATMQQAAAFAWQEFIALNWPAVKQTGGVVNNVQVNQRDVADSNCKFSDPSCTGPLVWETFRAKVEIFPGQPNFPPNSVPPGYPSVAQGDDSFGYDALPVYNYSSAVPACDSPAPTGTPWINLDETNQITLDSMYAGNAPAQHAGNSSPQLIRFLAKANRSQYTYVAKQGTTAQWWNALPPSVVQATQAYLVKNMSSPPVGGSDLVSVPYGTIETKAGWRVLSDDELKSGRFQTATARYYENSPNLCYRQDTFGLVALHIIQKTPTAPYFIYATFEQADNILTATGGKVEDQDGNINQPPPPCPGGQTAPCPTTPAVQLTDTPNVTTPGMVPPQVNLVPASASYCTPASQIYYINTAMLGGLPTNGPICINYRDNAIPAPVIQANQTAHAAIQSYLQANNISSSPWLYYKLINVQYVPIDKNYAGVYTGPVNDPNTSQNASSYHQANILVETNRTLQLFSGSLVNSGFTGANSDYASQFPERPPFPPAPPSGSTLIHKQVYYNGAQYNMGGCMGCHASQGQDQGGDFSVILARGSVAFPEPPAPVTSTGVAKIKRNRSLK